MSRASNARRSGRAQRRAMNRAGVAILHRITLDNGAITAAIVNGADSTELIAYHVALALDAIYEQGAEIIEGETVITIGRHPDLPGGLTIEAKAATRRPIVTAEPVIDDGCPIDHSLDGAGDE